MGTTSLSYLSRKLFASRCYRGTGKLQTDGRLFFIESISKVRVKGCYSEPNVYETRPRRIVFKAIIFARMYRLVIGSAWDAESEEI